MFEITDSMGLKWFSMAQNEIFDKNYIQQGGSLFHEFDLKS